MVAETTTPWDFGHELLQPDLDRIAPSLEVGFKHFPAFEKAGIKQIINGPFTFAPDGNPLVGPVQGLQQFLGAPAASWPASARAAASAWRCPTGWSTAIPASTSGAWTSPATANGRRWRYTNAKVRENYSRRFSHPLPQRGAARRRARCQTTPLYDTMVAQNAVMGDSWGLETPLWFAPEGHRAEGRRLLPPLQRLSRMSAARCRARARGRRRHRDRQLRQIRSHRARARRPSCPPDDQPACRSTGRIVLTPDAQRARQADRRLHASPRLGRRALPIVGLRPGARNTTCAGSSSTCRTTARSRIDALRHGRSSACRSPGRSRASCCSSSPTQDVSTAAFRFMDYPRDGRRPHARPSSTASPITGDLGYEIWVPPEYQRALLRRDHGGGRGPRHRPFRHARAALACGWRRTSAPGSASTARSTAPSRPASDRFVDLAKNDFIGRDAAAPREGDRRRAAGGSTFIVDAADADVHRRRADLARRQGGRLGHLRRLRALRRQASVAHGLRAEGAGGGGGRASRSRSSANGARRRSSPSRCSIRRGSGCGGEGAAPALSPHLKLADLRKGEDCLVNKAWLRD